MSARIVPIPTELDAATLRNFTDAVKKQVSASILQATLGLTYQDFEYTLKTTLTDRPNVQASTERTLTVSLTAYTSSSDQWSRLVGHLRRELCVENFEKLYDLKVVFKQAALATNLSVTAATITAGSSFRIGR